MKCGKKTLVYSRVVGYHNPVQNWNPGKREEFKARKPFKGGIESNVKIEGEAKDRPV